MSSIVVSGDTSGAVTLQAPAVAGTTTITLPSSSGTMALTSGATAFTNLTVTNDATISGLTVGKGGGAVSSNTVVGYQAGQSNTTNPQNTFVGYTAGYSSTGGYTSAFGYQAGYAITTGTSNTALGRNSMSSGTGVTGSNNTSVGESALLNLTSGASNVSVGVESLRANTTASNNTAVGYQAGYSNTSNYNTFLGYTAGYSFTGSGNTANTFIGNNSGYSMTTGSKNVILGGFSGNNGGLDIRTSSNYIVLSDGDGNPRGWWNSNGTMILGESHSPSYSATKLSVYRTGTNIRLVEFNNANNASGDENVRISLGTNANNTSSYGLILTTGGADKYYLYGNGTYGTISDRTLKKNIETTRNGYVDDLCKLRVVKYNWTTDEEGAPKELGWIAQEVEEVFPNLVQDSKPNEQGEVHKQVKTSVLPFMLLKAIQELKALVDAQATEIAELKAKL